TSSLIKIFVREYLTNNLLGLYSGIEGVPVLSAKSRLGLFNDIIEKFIYTRNANLIKIKGGDIRI
ncbi:MAG: hypothetical protein NOM71_06500, partial [Archaeoglobi archaeon]|nr:hypothetical protein [Archaeoglobi archaeon]